MLAIFLKTLPFFALIALGYLAGRTRFFSAEATSCLTRFVFYFALSAMLFRFAANLSFWEVLDWRLVQAYLVATLAVYGLASAVAALRGIGIEQAAVEAQCAVIGNVGFLGVPMLALLLGEPAVGVVMMILAVDLIVFGSLIVILITGARGGAASVGVLRTVGLGLLSNPMIVSIALGFGWSALELPIPAPMNEFLAILGGAATPGALFAIGASLASKSAERLSVALWLSFCKLILHPASVALCTMFIWPLDRYTAGVAVAATALPVAGNVYIIAQHYGVAPQRVSASILVSTAASVLTVSLVIAWIAGVNLRRVARPDSHAETEDAMRTISENACFGGVQAVWSHASATCDCDMTFGLFLPAEAEDGPVPILWYLSGLTCTHENAMTKAGAQAHAAAQGIALVFPYTSPRGEAVADDEAFDMGQGAGFYVNASEQPWARHFRMWDYVAEELPAALAGFPVDLERQAITGHSMGGHGELTLAMGLPGRFRSVSAFSPICAPSQSDWGRRQFTGYLGPDEADWAGHDASRLMADRGFDGPMLVDIGTADQFLDRLRPETLAEAIAKRRQQATFRMQPGYDHSYFFVSTFIEDHVDFHGEALWK